MMSRRKPRHVWQMWDEAAAVIDNSYDQCVAVFPKREDAERYCRAQATPHRIRDCSARLEVDEDAGRR